MEARQAHNLEVASPSSRCERPAPRSRGGGFSESPYPAPVPLLPEYRNAGIPEYRKEKNGNPVHGNPVHGLSKTEADLGRGWKGAARSEVGPARSDREFLILDFRFSIDEKFFAAIRTEESYDGKVPVGDGGLTRGDYHISRACWQDGCETGGVRWDYEIFVWSNRHCEQVMVFYWRRYCPDALKRGDLKTLARIHNGGPKGDRKAATLEYWRRIQKHMARGKPINQ